MNENGFSYIESLLSIVILFTITALLIPIQLHMNSTLELAKAKVHVSEAALNGAVLKRNYDMNNGHFIIDHQRYEWLYNDGEICVSYTWKGKVDEMCLIDETT